MNSVDLSWLDELPDYRICGVPGVPGVLAQKTASFNGTPVDAVGVPGVPRNTLEHLGTSAGVPAETAENRHGTPGTPGTPQKWDRLSGKPGEVGEWAKLLAIREAMLPPTAIEEDRWRQVLTDAHAFLSRWGKQAKALGWTAVDLFSVPPGPDRWVNRAGLVALLHGRPVVAMTDEAITIANVRGGPNRYRRSEKMEAVMLWDARAFTDEGNT